MPSNTISPVAVQWLVKKAIETREERQQEIRNRAMHEFAKRGQTPQDAAFADALPTAMLAADSVKDSYKPRRQFRAPGTADQDEETRVHTTLLECVIFRRASCPHHTLNHPQPLTLDQLGATSSRPPLLPSIPPHLALCLKSFTHNTTLPPLPSSLTSFFSRLLFLRWPQVWQAVWHEPQAGGRWWG